MRVGILDAPVVVARQRFGVGQLAHRGLAMSYYRPSVDATDEHRWQRYNIGLDATALVDVRAWLEREATGLWSFRLLPASISSLLDPVYTFFFREMSDVVVIQSFDRQRRA